MRASCSLAGTTRTSTKAFWGFDLHAADHARVGPLRPQIVQITLRALNFALRPDPLMLQHRYLLGGVLLHQRHVLLVILQVLLQLGIVRVRNVEITDKAVVLSGRQPNMVAVRAIFVRGETKNTIPAIVSLVDAPRAAK